MTSMNETERREEVSAEGLPVGGGTAWHDRRGRGTHVILETHFEMCNQ